MKTLYITTGVVALVVLSFAQSSAPPAPPAAEARVSNSHIHLFSKDPEVQRHFWVDVRGATARKVGADDIRIELLSEDKLTTVSENHWGTRMELTEMSAPPPSAQNKKPAQQ